MSQPLHVPVIDRRTFLAGTGSVLLAAPLIAEAQIAGTYRIAYVNSASETEERKPHVQALRTALRELGYVEGRNLIFDITGIQILGDDLMPKRFVTENPVKDIKKLKEAGSRLGVR